MDRNTNNKQHFDENEARQELQRRQEESQGMNQILEMVSDMSLQPTQGPREEPFGFAGLQEELAQIDKEQKEVLQKLDAISQLYQTTGVPAALTNLLSTWKAVTDQSTPFIQLPPAFNYKYLWFKLDGLRLFNCAFTGHNHVKTVDTVGVETDGDLVEGTKKMMYVENGKLVISHRRVIDGIEVMRIEVFVTGEELYYVFQRDHYRFIRVYERAFKKE